MAITKGDLISGVYALMRISGLTVNPTPEDVVVGLSIADDYAAELKGEGLDLGWQYPSSYGSSDPADNSGLTPEMAGPFKKLLFIQLCSAFGKDVPMAVAATAAQGKRVLENILVSVPVAQNPSTLPIGSGNQDRVFDERFYGEPPKNNDADYVYRGNILNYSHDFSSWLVDETLVSVEWTLDSSNASLGTESFTDQVATAELTFNGIGGLGVSITATKTNSTDKLTVVKNFIISDSTGLIYNA